MKTTQKNEQNEEEFKFIEETTLEVTRVVGNITDVNGVTSQRASKSSYNKSIELGSLANPKNTDIINVKYRIPGYQKNKNKIDFSGLFGK